MDQNNNEGTTASEATKPVAEVPAAESNANDQVPTPPPIPTASEDLNLVKLFAIGGYILPFFFFLPLLDEKTKRNQFSLFHANQQLLLLAVWLVVEFVVKSLVFSFLSPLAAMFSFAVMLSGLLSIGLIALAIFGVVSAASGTMKRLPLVGHIELLSKFI